MANFCYTSYYFEGDAACLQDFHKRLKRLEEDNTVEDYRKRRGMTRLAECFGLDVATYYCRGHFDYPEFEESGGNGKLTFGVESANCPCENLIEAIMEYYNHRISVLWFVECTDDGEYFTNDREGRVFSSRYQVELEDIDAEWFCTIPEVVEWIKEQTGVAIPKRICSNTDCLYEYIISDFEEILGVCCNFHVVEVM